MSHDLEAAFDELVTSISRAASELRAHPLYASEENRAGAHTFLISMLLARLEEHVVFDPDFPYFRVLDQRIREGGDNPDQRYLISRLRGGVEYRVWGRLGDARRLEFQVYAGDPYDGGRMAGYLGAESLKTHADGTFEVRLGGSRTEGNWLDNPPDATRLLVRQIHSDWSGDLDPGEVHVDRVGGEGDLKPVLDGVELSDRIAAAAEDLLAQSRAWPRTTFEWFQSAPNVLGTPFDPGSRGGVPGRWMVRGHFDLAPDDCLVITTWPGSGNYQGVQLADAWFSSLEYANRQTSLTADQAETNPDGSTHFVIAARDPGTANWLDTCGRRTGVIMLRYDGCSGPLAEDQWPVATKVHGDALAAVLSEGDGRFGAEKRRAQLAQRRKHVQRRFGI